MNNEETLKNYEQAREAVRVYGRGDRALCWGSMIYACRGLGHPHPPEGCGHEERYWLGVGVEGPPTIRARVLLEGFKASKVGYIPCPFYAGRCPNCGGNMAHVSWDVDEAWIEPILAPPSVRYFRVPDEEKERRYRDQGYGGAELIERRQSQ